MEHSTVSSGYFCKSQCICDSSADRLFHPVCITRDVQAEHKTIQILVQEYHYQKAPPLLSMLLHVAAPGSLPHFQIYL